MSTETFSVDAAAASLGLPPDVSTETPPENASPENKPLEPYNGYLEERERDSAQWLARIRQQDNSVANTSRKPYRKFYDQRAQKLSMELNMQKRRTMEWLVDIGYQGVLQLWREDLKGLAHVIASFERLTGQSFSPSLILDFMESHDRWPSDLEDIVRTHAYLIDAHWHQEFDKADIENKVSVEKAKAFATLLFERAGTLNRQLYSRSTPKDEAIGLGQVQINIMKDGVSVTGAHSSQMAERQKQTAMARVRYGTSAYEDPPMLTEWQRGDFEIPDEKVEDYLMLKWLPDVPRETIVDAEVVEETSVETLVGRDESGHKTLDLGGEPG